MILDFYHTIFVLHDHLFDEIQVWLIHFQLLCMLIFFLNLKLHVIFIYAFLCQRTATQDEELELLFAGLSLWTNLSRHWSVSVEFIFWNKFKFVFSFALWFVYLLGLLLCFHMAWSIVLFNHAQCHLYMSLYKSLSSIPFVVLSGFLSRIICIGI